ncbi:Protein Rf1 [Chlorella vulgaris]
MGTIMPACLKLTCQPQILQRHRRSAACRQQLMLSCAAGERRWVAVSAAPPAATRRFSAPRQQPSSDRDHPMDHSRNARFDKALRAGRLHDALAVLQEAAAAGGISPIPLLEPHRNRALIQACFARNSPDKALAYLQLLHPRIAPWSAVMKEANKRHDLPTLLRVLAAREAAGLSLDHRTTTSAIRGLSAAGKAQDAMAIFCRAWERRECRTVEVVNAAISACAPQGSWQAAQEVVAVMEEEGIWPDSITYNALINVAGAAGLMDEAVRLYGELKAARLSPTPFTYATLFTAAAKTGYGDISWLLQTFDEMIASHVEPNNWVVSALYSAASYMHCTPGQQDRLFAVLALLRSYGPANDTVYSSLLTFVQRQGIQERAVDVWAAVKQDGVKPTPHILSALFAACPPEASSALVEVALEAADEMQALWISAVRRAAPKPHYERDMLVAYNALLHFLGSIGKLQRTLAFYSSMRRRGPTPDVVTYNTLISSTAARGNVRDAMLFFSDMVDADIEPTQRTAGALLNCYAKARDPTSARRVFEGMQLLGVKPNLEMYTSLVDACVAAGGKDTEMAFELVDEMRRQGLAPSVITYGCLLAACEKQGDVSRAFKLYQQACKEGVVPSDQMHDMLISMCTEAQRLDDAVDLVKRLARTSLVSHPSGQGAAGQASSGQAAAAAAAAAGQGANASATSAGSSGAASVSSGGLHEHTLNSLIRALCSKNVDRALRLLSLLQTMGLRPSKSTYLSLITGCAKASRSTVAYDLYRSLRSQAMDADSASASALIVSLCQANQLDVAETVYNDMLACAWRRELEGAPGPQARRGGLSNHAQLPDEDALAALVQAFATSSDLRSAAKYYKQLRRVGKVGLAAVAVSQRRMWEALIENNCRQHRVKQALQVFDDWKAARDDWLAAQQQHLPNNDRHRNRPVAAAAASSAAAAAAARYPKLSSVTLAFLEACCRSEPEHEWRIYDVCAVMRQQRELKDQAGLARPQKQSHHVRPA